ncbi:NAD-dependent epimerase/dehydratase family protein [Weissella confusa]|uniref:NAD-dependent epimerase/dehydratase family protein n=1 Tax=Weissella confusa TaxID=1583 RepID=UPI0035A317A0
MAKRKIVIAGGTGFVGQGITNALLPEKYDIHVLTRRNVTTDTESVTYHHVDYHVTEQVLAVIGDADWVIDVIGILLPNPIKHQTYANSSVLPAKFLIDAVRACPEAKFMFVSANYAPFFMAPYMRAKQEVENYMALRLPQRATTLYPGIIYDRQRQISYYVGHILAKIHAKRLRPIKLTDLAEEVTRILDGHESDLEKRR